MNPTPQQIYAKIKRSSSYYGQTDPNELFPVFISPCLRGYVINGGPGGRYRLSDVNLFIIDEDGKSLRIS